MSMRAGFCVLSNSISKCSANGVGFASRAGVPFALRLRVQDGLIKWDDAVYGHDALRLFCGRLSAGQRDVGNEHGQYKRYCCHHCADGENFLERVFSCKI